MSRKLFRDPVQKTMSSKWVNMKFGYARVATANQNAELQVDALLAKGVGRDKIYVAVASGRHADRSDLNSLLKALCEGVELIVWRLDRIGRSTKNLFGLVDQLAARGVEVTSLQERIEIRSAPGKLMLTGFAAIASFACDLLVERTNAGLVAARARGRKGGRPPALLANNLRLARAMLADANVSVTDGAKHFKIRRNTLYRSLRRGEL